MTEIEAGIETLEGDLARIEKTMDLVIEIDQHLGIKVKRGDVIIAENQESL